MPGAHDPERFPDVGSVNVGFAPNKSGIRVIRCARGAGTPLTPENPREDPVSSRPHSLERLPTQWPMFSPVACDRAWCRPRHRSTR